MAAPLGADGGSFPEIDRAEWTPLEPARTRLVKGQIPALDALAQMLGGP